MIPTDREELQTLAGEYVLGTLAPEAAREVDAARATNEALRDAIAFWEERLHPLSRLAQPAPPPPETWDAISSRLGFASSPGIWRSLALWRGTTAAAAAIATCLALYIALTPAPTAPSFVAILRAPQQDKAAWVATSNRGGMLLRAVASNAAPNDRSFELWAIAPGATQPRSLGLIPADGKLELGVIPAALRDGGVLAISIEPKTGSPTGLPTGPVVFTGELVRAN
jgi:anti-sigma-K factor RskA